MVKITEELIRKRSEHNECIIGTLEELSLHQEDIEKIEHLNNWCKELQILYLQANLISKIENLNKLKKLQYLNLAINNIETIENLSRCESLEKLDLTLNFIGNLESISNLKNNFNLKHLHLTGNPCCDYNGYRDYVVTILPQLLTLDSVEISKSEKIKATQNFNKAEENVKRAQKSYEIERKHQIERAKYCENDKLSDELFWKSTSENSPEARVEIAKRSKKSKNNRKDDNEKEEKKPLSLFAKSGRPLNINQAKIKFKFNEEHAEKFILELEVYKYLDTNLIEIDLQPIYVRISIKGKVFQFVFPEEILTDKSSAKRSQTTGHLVLEIPRANFKPSINTKMIKKHNRKVEMKSNFLEVPDRIPENCLDIIAHRNVGISEIPPLEYV